GSVLLAAGLIVGCGDDGGSNVGGVVDAGSDAAVTEASSGADTTEQSTILPGDTSEAPGQSAAPATTGDDSTAATSEPSPTTQPAGDTSGDEGSTDESGTDDSEPQTTDSVATSAPDESTVPTPCGDVGELCCAATEGNPRGTCNEGYQCNNPAGGGL